ncbi:hypothetical protein D3C72_1517850 [compost metagenome]
MLSLITSAAAARSLNGVWVMPPGNGAKSLEYLGWPPADTVNSVRPWKALLNATIWFLLWLPLSSARLRASFSAASLASAPELQKNTFSAKVASISSLANRSTGSLV